MRKTLCLTLILLACLSLIAPTSRGAEDEAPAAPQPAAELWEQIAKDLGHAGELKDNVYTVTLLRTDMEIRHDDGDVDVPAALLKTEFQFYRCDCGKMNVVGQFCLFEYESNDVIDALRDGRMKVVSVSPMFQGEHPRVTLVRFQGGGGSQRIAETLKNALQWTGEARMAPTTRPVG
jgi:hypothetical protein